MIDNILEICNIRYKEIKLEKFLYTAPELLPSEISSDQVKVVIEVFQNLFNGLLKENLELKDEIKNIKIELNKKQNKNTNAGFGPY